MRKMKDSGIEWIGEIPEGWEVAKLKNIVSIVRGGSPRPIEAYMSDNDNDVNWICISDTEKGSKYITHTYCFRYFKKPFYKAWKFNFNQFHEFWRTIYFRH